MMTPTVHLNGTSKEALVNQYCDAISAIREAGTVLALAYPNARDFYPQGPDAILKALREHDARMIKLQEIAAELETIVTIITNGETHNV